MSGQDIASYTEGAILGIYNVVERRNLERVLDEQKLALSGILFEKVHKGSISVGAQGIMADKTSFNRQDTLRGSITKERIWWETGINATAQQVLDKVREELGKE